MRDISVDLEPTGNVLWTFSCNGEEAEILVGLFRSDARFTGNFSTFLGRTGGLSITVEVLSDEVHLGTSTSCESSCLVGGTVSPQLACPLSASCSSI